MDVGKGAGWRVGVRLYLVLGWLSVLEQSLDDLCFWDLALLRHFVP